MTTLGVAATAQPAARRIDSVSSARGLVGAKVLLALSVAAMAVVGDLQSIR